MIKVYVFGYGITPVSFTIGGSATGANLTGSLPNGVSGSLSGNVFTVSVRQWNRVHLIIQSQPPDLV